VLSADWAGSEWGVPAKVQGPGGMTQTDALHEPRGRPSLSPGTDRGDRRACMRWYRSAWYRIPLLALNAAYSWMCIEVLAVGTSDPRRCRGKRISCC
jgi:hypothetical protein